MPFMQSSLVGLGLRVALRALMVGPGLGACSSPPVTPSPETASRPPIEEVAPPVASVAPDAVTAAPDTGATSIDAAGPEPTTTEVRPLDLREPGVYVAGRWEYRFTIVARGSKSEGTRGALLFDGKAVPEPRPGDYYRTPWGDLVWLGYREVMWGAQGWMPREPGASGGQRLVEPWRAEGAPVVVVMVLGEARAGDASETLDAEVAAALTRLGVRSARVLRTWTPITDQALPLEDTKMYGSLTVRQAQARAPDTLTVLVDGTRSRRVVLPRRDGATTVVQHILDGGMEPETRYVALRVERAAPGWPAPLDLGPEVEGKVVAVRGVGQVVIALPSDLSTGLVWVVKSLVGDAPTRSPLEVVGVPQFVPTADPVGVARPGVFENLFRVVATGRAEVVLELHRPWQGDVPADKTFRVTLEVVELPMSAPTPK